MLIDVLQCAPDGTQTIIRREVPDDYFSPAPEIPSVPDYRELISGLLEGYGDE